MVSVERIYEIREDRIHMSSVAFRFVRFTAVIAVFSLMDTFFIATAPAVDFFQQEGTPQGWVVTDWSDISKPAPEGAQWSVSEGVLHGSDPRGTGAFFFQAEDGIRGISV